MFRPLAIGLVCAIFVATGPSPSFAALTPEQEATAERLILDFRALAFAVRQEAVDELVKMGPDVLPLIERTRDRTTDAEVKLRCEMVIKALTQKPAKRFISARLDEKIIRVLGPMAYGRAEDGWDRNVDGSGRIFRFRKDGKWHVCHNDWESDAYDAVNGLTMTRDGKVSGFLAQRGKKQMMVIQREEQPAYERVAGLTFSEDGMRSLYAGVREKSVYVVVDGKERGPYAGLRTPVGFSPDNRHAAWVAIRGGRDFFVLDDHESPPHDFICTLRHAPTDRVDYNAPHLQRYFAVDEGCVRLVEVDYPKSGPPDAPLVEREIRVVCRIEADLAKSRWVATADGGHLIYRTFPEAPLHCDGKKLVTWDEVVADAVSSDGSVAVFVGRRGDKWYAVSMPDGKVTRPYDYIYSLWMPVRGHYSYAATRDGKTFCLFDGRDEFPGWDDVSRRAFSEDGRHWAHTAKDGKDWVVVRDGRVVARHEGLGFMNFDPSGERLAYIAIEAGRQFIVCEGRRGENFEMITQGPTFSRDGKHLWYAVRQNGKHFVVIDGITGPIHDGGIQMCEQFDGKGAVRYVFVDSQDIENLAEVPWPRDVDWTNGLEEID